jgi:hypothetical protein
MNFLNSSCDNTDLEYKSVIFKRDIEPKNKNGYEYYLNNIQRAVDFKKVENTKLNNCNKILYYAQDPRLMDVRRGNNIYPLSEPPLDGGQPFIPSNFKLQ